MSIWEQAAFAIGRLTARIQQAGMQVAANTPTPWAEQYDLLKRYYQSNDLYSAAEAYRAQNAIKFPAMRPIRNPAFQIVEFYVATVWPGPLARALPIEAENDKLEAAITRIWTWSNWAVKKQVAARRAAMLGDWFVKIAANDEKTRVFFDQVDPAYVTDMTTDERGFLTFVRIDVPILTTDGGGLRRQTHVELWSKSGGSFRQYLLDGVAPKTSDVERQRPVAEIGLQDLTGGDFIPIVHVAFMDVGEARGVGAFTLQKDAIDECNLKATRLSQQLFRHNAVTWAIESQAADAEGGHLPALKVKQDGTVEKAQVLQIGEDSFYSLPGGYSLSSMVPTIDYDASLKVLDADLAFVEQAKPEMAYWRIPQGDVELSGRALQIKLLPAIARAEEARGNLEAGLVRANQIAMTMAAHLRLPDFTNLGRYEQGALDHGFKDRPVIPLSDLEEAQGRVQSATAMKLQTDAGVPLRFALLDAGKTEQEVDDILTQKEKDDADAAAAQAALFDKQAGATMRVQNDQPPGRANGRPAGPPRATGAASA